MDYIRRFYFYQQNMIAKFCICLIRKNIVTTSPLYHSMKKGKRDPGDVALYPMSLLHDPLVRRYTGFKKILNDIDII